MFFFKDGQGKFIVEQASSGHTYIVAKIHISCLDYIDTGLSLRAARGKIALIHPLNGPDSVLFDPVFYSNYDFAPVILRNVYVDNLLIEAGKKIAAITTWSIDSFTESYLVI